MTERDIYKIPNTAESPLSSPALAPTAETEVSHGDSETSLAVSDRSFVFQNFLLSDVSYSFIVRSILRA